MFQGACLFLIFCKSNAFRDKVWKNCLTRILILFPVLGEHTNYETDGDGNRTFSEGEGDTSRADDPDSVLSPKKEKKKKVLKTPSFLKKKKKDKKEKEKA